MPKETLDSEIVMGCKLDILAICCTIKKVFQMPVDFRVAVEFL